MCGFPAGWISPSERSTTFGTSSLTTYCDASMKPGEPGWMRSLPDCVSNNGSQPTSSSDPEQITRSALRMRAIRLGRASMRCGSCLAVVADTTETLSPPNSWASAPHSGSQANTLSAAHAGHARMPSANPRKTLKIDFMWTALEPVRAVRAQAHDVLEEHLVIGLAHARVVARELQADAAELAGTPIDHGGMALRLIRGEDRKIRRSQRARIHQPDRRDPGVELVVPVTDTPLRNELVYALQIPARLPRRVAVAHGAQRLAQRIESKGAVFFAFEVFTLQLEVPVGRVPVRGPLEHAVHDPKLRVAGEAVGDAGAERIDVVVDPALRRGAQVRKPRLPGIVRSDVSAEVSEDVAGADAVLVALGGG